MNDIGKYIQEMRVRAGFTQNSLGDALNITGKAISKWERGICLPDVSLLPKLSLLLDVDMDLLVSKTIEHEEWIGLIDIQECDFSQTVYDKPLAYYILIHFLLLNITSIYVLTSKENQEYLQDPLFTAFGFHFYYERPNGKNMMILNHPWFLFGSDLTQQFQGAMLSDRNTKLVPENQNPVFLFIHGDGYFKDKKKSVKAAAKRTLGRGMVCFDMGEPNKLIDVATFVRTYQNNAGLTIGSLEDVAYRNGTITAEQIKSIARTVTYGELLKRSCRIE